MIVLTGGAGFIGSAFLWKLNSEGIDNILVVDDLGESEKWKNLVGKKFNDYMHKDQFLEGIIDDKFSNIEAIIHLGACSSTAETDIEYLMDNNYHYTKELAAFSIAKKIRFIYASSAATYGDGSRGFSDEDDITPLKPLNAYAFSKQIFDMWALKNKILNKITGIKFFNVFGPNEYHKGDMLSVPYRAFRQIIQSGKVRLFKSYKDDYNHGEQKRDFVYIKDCVDVMWWFFGNKNKNGIYNLGTGKARTWNDLAKAVFAAMGIDAKIEYIEMPEEMKEKYQYFTEAKAGKLHAAGCPVVFRTLEDAIRDYVLGYLLKNAYL